MENFALGYFADATTNTNENANIPTTSTPKASTDTKEQVCGLSRRVDTLASDGRVIPLGQFPWNAGVFVRNYNEYWMDDKWTYQCAGSLITNRVVVTRSSSVEYRRVETIRVAFAKFDQDWEKDEPYTVRRNVSAVTVPLTVEDGSWASDFGNAWNIALILLSNSVEFNDHVMPVCRPAPSSGFVYITEAQVVSWNGRHKTLEQKDVTIYKCAEKGRPKSTQICGESVNSTTSAVGAGDAGAGLTIEVNGKHHLIGLVNLKFPEVAVFTNVSYPDHQRWLDDKMSKFDDAGKW